MTFTEPELEIIKQALSVVIDVYHDDQLLYKAHRDKHLEDNSRSQKHAARELLVRIVTVIG